MNAKIRAYQEKRELNTRIMQMEREAKESISQNELQTSTLCRFIRYMSEGCGDCPYGDIKTSCGLNATDKATAIKSAQRAIELMEAG